MNKNYEDNYVLVKDLTKQYQNKTIIDHLNLTITKQQRIAIVGPNGCGKTTLCEIIAAIRKPTSGNIILKDNLRIGMQLQESQYPKGVSGWDLANFYLNSYHSQKSTDEIQKLLYYLDAEAIFQTPIITLSSGQQQKINLLLALIVDPELLILDELATGLDLEIRERIYDFLSSTILHQENLALLMVTHNMQEVERFCNQILFMLKGKIISISDVATVITEYGSVEMFVKKQFKEYKVGMYDETKQLSEHLTPNQAQVWVKKRTKKLQKSQKVSS